MIAAAYLPDAKGTDPHVVRLENIDACSARLGFYINMMHVWFSK